MGGDVEQLKQRWPLLDYLQHQNWAARPAGYDSEFVGLCPLHQETRPSFYVNARKNLFYCHGCGQGGDLIRFVELSRHLSFRQSLAYLEQQSAPPVDSATVLNEVAAFYQEQLDRYPEALRYLERRGVHDPALIKELRIGYAPGGCLRRHLTAQGYSFDLLRQLGLVNSQGRDTFYGRVGVIDSLLAAQHVLEMFRRVLPHGYSRACLDRLSNRLTKIVSETRKLRTP